MDERNEELERIQNELLAQESDSVEDILSDEELDSLLGDTKQPAFEDPDEICDPEGEMQYNNYANDYGNDDATLLEETRRRDRIHIGLMITACALCLGIIGILIYWLNFLQ